MTHLELSSPEIRDPALKKLVFRAAKISASEVHPIQGRRVKPRSGRGHVQMYQLLGASFRVLDAPEGGGSPEGCRLFSVNTRSAPRLTPRGARFRWAARGGEGRGVVVDGHTSGLGVAIPARVAPQRQRLVSLQVAVGGTVVRGAARVVRRSQSQGTVRLGLDFSPEEAEAQWVDALLRDHAPQLVSRRSVPSERVIELMRSSGYLGLRSGKGVPESWLGLELPGLSWDRIYVDEASRAVGHVSITRAYRRTWVGHQLACRQRHREAARCNRELYLLTCFVPLLADGDEAMALAYFDRDKTWHKNYFEAFVRWMGDARHAVIANIERHECVDGAASQAPLPNGRTIRPARGSELGLVSRWVRSGVPELTAAALDLAPESLRSHALHPGYSATHFERSREVVVFEKDGRPRAAVLLERGTGLSLFGLFDRAHFAWPEDSRELGVDDRAAFARWVLAWYRARGVPQPLMTWAASSSVHDVPGLKHSETMGLMTLSSRALRHYENFVEFTTNLKTLRRRKRAAA